MRTIERFALAESGSHDSVDDNGSFPDTEIAPKWLNTWSDDQLRTWQHQEPAIRQFIHLKENSIAKPPKSVVLDASHDL
jgi:hypothetical protein